MKKSLLGWFALASLTFAPTIWGEPGEAIIRTRAQRDAMTPQQVLDSLRAGNERFVGNDRKPRDLQAEQRATAAGQHPSAVILSCIDSRAPAEFLFDKGIGETFNARVAGPVFNPDLAGSLEFACAVAGAKLVLVLGHTRCGAVNGAIDEVEMGNLTGLLGRIKPAVDAVGTSIPGDHTSQNRALADAVVRANVRHTVSEVRRVSPILSDLEKQGKIKIVGALYDVETGRVEFLDGSAAP